MSTVDMRTQKQKILAFRKWARMHPKEYRELMRKSTAVEKQKYLEMLRKQELEKIKLKEVAAQKESTKQQYREWQANVRAQYPSSKYIVKFTDSGKVQIQKRPQPGQLKEIAAWSKGLGRRIDKPPTETFGPPLAIEKTPESLRAEGKFFAAYLLEKQLQKEKPPGLFAEYLKTRDIERGWHRPEGGESEHWVTVQEFEKLYGAKPTLPETAKITYMKRVPKGYELQYYTPKGPPKTITEWFDRTVIGTDVPIVGGPVGGIIGTQSLGFQIKTWEATYGKIEQQITGEATARSELMSTEELLIAHGIFATIAAIKFTPKIIERIAGTPIGKSIKFSRTAKIFTGRDPDSQISKAIAGLKKKLPAWRGSRLDVRLAKRKGLYYEKTRGIARGEVGQSPLQTTFFKGRELPKVGLQEFELAGSYWEMIQAPRTGGVMIAKSPTILKPLQTFTFEWVLKAGQLVPRFRPMRIEEAARHQTKYWQGYWQPERGLTPFVSQQQLTRMGVHPYVGGKVSGALGKKVVSPILIAPTTDLTKAPGVSTFQLKEWEPTLTRQHQKIEIAGMEEIKKRQRDVSIPMMKLGQLQRQQLRLDLRLEQKTKKLTVPADIPAITYEQPVEQAQAQTPITVIEPVQRQKHFVPLHTPELVTEPPPIPPFLRTPFGGTDVSRGSGEALGLWFKRTHPIKSAEDMFATFVGKKKTRKKGGVLPWF